jgi:hypothetical protein
LVNARQRGDYAALSCFGFLVLALAVACLLCLAVPLVRRNEALAARSTGIRKGSWPKDDYLAKYFAQDQVIAVSLALVFGALTVLLLLLSPLIEWGMVCLGFFCYFVWYAIHVTTTSIRFTRERIIARLPGFRTISEPYTAIQKLQSKPGTLRVEFSDGLSLKLYSGLGDPESVISYLQTHCPESVYPKEWSRRC